MTRREMLKECKDGAVRNLPRLLGTVGGVWAGLGKLIEPDPNAATKQPACFPSVRPDEQPTPIPDSVGE